MPKKDCRQKVEKKIYYNNVLLLAYIPARMLLYSLSLSLSLSLCYNYLFSPLCIFCTNGARGKKEVTVEVKKKVTPDNRRFPAVRRRAFTRNGEKHCFSHCGLNTHDEPHASQRPAAASMSLPTDATGSCRHFGTMSSWSGSQATTRPAGNRAIIHHFPAFLRSCAHPRVTRALLLFLFLLLFLRDPLEDTSRAPYERPDRLVSFPAFT